MRVGAKLDEAQAQRVADRAERTFNDAGVRAGQGFGSSFQAQVEDALHERALEKSARRIESQMARTGKTSAEAFNQAIAAEADRTGLAADKIGSTLTERLGVHATSAGQEFAATLSNELSKVAPMLGGIVDVARGAASSIGAAGGIAAGGVAAIGAAAVESAHKLWEVGETFDNVAKSVEIQTGKMGSDLEALTSSIDHVAIKTASSIDSIGGVAASVSQAFHVTGEPLEHLTKQISDLDRMTGEHLNVREFGKTMRAFGLDATQAGDALDSLKVASENTGAPLGELVSALNTIGPAARSLHLDIGQTAALIDMFDQAGIDATSTTRGLNKAVSEAVTHHVDLKTVLSQAVEEIHHFLEVGDEQKAQELGIKLFGTRGAQQFVDAIRQGKLTVDDLNDSLKDTSSAGHIEKLNDDTLRWADTWTIVKNRIEDALKPLADPLFFTVQEVLRTAAGVPGDQGLPKGYSNPAIDKPGAPSSNPLAPLTSGPPPGGGAPPIGSLSQILGGPPVSGAPGSPAPGAPAPAGPGGPGPGDHPLSDQLNTDPNKPFKPAIPYGPGYGAPPEPGESQQHWKDRMSLLEKQHDVAEKRAELDDLEKNHTDQQDDIVRKRNEVLRAQMDADDAQRTLNSSVSKAAVPFGAGYGAAPRPGETSQQYSAEQGVLEADQKRRQAQAQLDQLQSSSTATDEEKTKARNDLAAAERSEYEAQLRLQEASKGTTKQLDQLGAEIDADFGISKGIPGIVDNMVRVMADLGAAPMLGQLSAIKQANEQNTGIQGGYGILGILGAQHLAQGRSPILGRPLDGTTAMPGTGTPGGAPGGGYGGDATLLAGVPAGRYDASGDLMKGLGDCSSAVEDLVNIMDGQPTAGRAMSTANAPEWLTQHGFVPTNVPMPGTFQVGFNPAHMQATLPGGTNFNWGSDAAAQARGVGGTGAWDPAFTQHYYRPAGPWAGGPAGPGGSALGAGAGTVPVFVTNMPGGGFGPVPGAPAAPGAGGGGGAPGGAAPPAPGAGGKQVGPDPGPGGHWRTNVDGSQTAIDAGGNATGGYIPGPGGPGAGGHPPAAPPPAAAPSPKAPAAPGGPPVGSLSGILGGPPVIGPGGPGPLGGGVAPSGHLADWDKIAGPEAGGDWHNASNPKYKGGLQFDQQTWDRHGGQQFAPRADLASPEQQKIIADRTLQAQGPGAWPATSAAHPDWFAPPGGGGPHVQAAGFGTGAPAAPAPWAAGPGGAGPGGAGAGPTKIGGVEPASNAAGGQAGITAGGSVDTAISMAASALDVMAPGAGQAAQVGIKLANRAIQYGAQAAGIGASGLMEAFLPTGGSELANKSWLTKVAGGIAGARPAIPNLAGGAGAQAMKPDDKKGGQGGADGGKGDQTINQSVTVNQASNNPANDVTHQLGVMAQSQYSNAPAMGR